MTIKKVAETLNNSNYRFETNPDIEYEAKRENIVIVFPYSDDCIEFRGAIDNELSCFGGGKFYIDSKGLVENKCDNEECPYYEEKIRNSIVLKANFNVNGYLWTYNIPIPHEEFIIIREDVEKWAIGIVFNLSDIS